MTTQLIKYEAACRALAECKSVDEVKSWADKAAAMQAYGRMAKDKTLEIDAAEIRIRAERRLGEMLAAAKAEGVMATGVRMAGSKPGANDGSSAVVADDRRPMTTTLAEAGISKDLSSRAQKLAAVPESEFEATLAEKRERDRQEGARVSAKLEKAGEDALKKKAVEVAVAVAASGASKHDDPLAEVYGDKSLSELLDEQIAENRMLVAQMAEWEQAMQATDKDAKIASLVRRLEHAERARDDAMRVCAAEQALARKWAQQLDRIGKAVGETDKYKVAPVVEALVRQAKRAA